MKRYNLPRTYRLNLTAFEMGELMGAISLLKKIRPEFAEKMMKRLDEAYQIVQDRKDYPGVRQLENPELETKQD